MPRKHLDFSPLQLPREVEELWKFQWKSESARGRFFLTSRIVWAYLSRIRRTV